MAEFDEDELDDVEGAAEYHDEQLLHDKPTVARKSVYADERGQIRTRLKAKKSDWVRNIIHLEGAKFSFHGRDYLRPIYDRNDSQILLKTSRQVEKTTFLANNLVVDSIINPFYKSLYVSPSHTQTRQFSSEKLKPAIERSPLVNTYYQDSFVSTQVFEKGFSNGSFVFLRSAFRSADRTRGISAQNLALDEIQDFIGSEIPVIKECTSHYPEKARILEAGTPKSFSNVIEEYWQESSMNEWLVRCTRGGCGHWNFLDETNIAPTDWYTSGKRAPGPICKKCSHSIHPATGKWISYNKGARVQGYRISQLQVPWIYQTMKQWDRLLQKRDSYPASQLANEVLGLSFDNASSPLSREDVMRACSADEMWNLVDPVKKQKAVTEAKRYAICAGIDWGEGNDASEKGPTGKLRVASYTVFTIGAYVRGDLFKVFYQRKYTGHEVDPDFVLKDIIVTCRLLNVRLVGCDWGHGFGMNNVLIRELGFTRVPLFQYVPKLKLVMSFNKDARRYMIQRNFFMSELFFDIKKGFVEFPQWKDEEYFAKDYLGIFAEYSEYARDMKFDHKATNPDDSFHSLLLCRLTAQIHTGKSRKYTAIRTEYDVDE